MNNPDAYYQVVKDNARYSDSWFLGEPLDGEAEEIDARLFTYCLPYRGPRPQNLPIDAGGKRVAFNLAAFDMPVVTEKIADVIQGLVPGTVERYPVLIDSHISGYEILNVLPACRCVNEKASRIQRYTDADDRPDLVGQYCMIFDLVIDATRVGGRDIFRVEGWDIALIVSHRLRRALQQFEDLGVEFLGVTR